MYRLPAIISPGATIGVIAPASAARRKPTATGIAYLKARGYRVITAPNLTRGHFYLAGQDQRRKELLECFLLDPAVDAVFCVRGGYGMLRIIDRLDYDRLAAIPPKILVGYSDITAIQLALLARLGWVTYSGPMVAPDMGNAFDPYSEAWLWRLLNTHPYPIDLTNPADDPVTVFRPGDAEGPLISGCLSLITPLLGTSYAPSLRGAILALEDVHEKGYRLDKHLHILRLHGVFDQIAGLVLGRFTDCFPANPRRSFTLEELLADVLGNYHFPVLTNFAYGHIRRRLTLPFGIRMRMTSDPLQITLLG